MRGTLRVERRPGVAVATIDHPPINLLDAALRADLDAFSREVAEDEGVRVVVLRSADPEFFVAHADIHGEVARYETPPPYPTRPGGLQSIGERFRTMPKATIAQIEGRARGGGAELALAFDMRFAARGRALIGMPEVPLGMVPGGGGTQRLARLAGRGRALEALLSGCDLDASLAERYGIVNRALEPDEIGPFVDRLADRIASFPGYAVALTKEAVDAALPPMEPGLLEEYDRFNRTIVEERTTRRLRAALGAGAQTRAGELDLEGLWAVLQDADTEPRGTLAEPEAR